MKNRGFAVAALATLTFQPALAQAPQEPWRDLLVYVRPKTPGGMDLGQGGTGVLLNRKGFIITAKHVIGDAFDPALGEITISHRSKSSYQIPARLVKCSDDAADICILHVSSDALPALNTAKYFNLTCAMPAAGTPLKAAGFPLDPWSPAIEAEGKLQTHSIAAHFKYYMDIRTTAGMSGGPVYSADFSLVGIIFGKGAGTEIFLLNHFAPAKPLIEGAEVPCPFQEISVKGDTIIKTMAVPIDIAKQLSVSVEEASKIIKAEAPPLPKDATIYLQVPGADEKKFALEAQSVFSLNKAPFSVAKGIEAVGQRAPATGEIRYFQEAYQGTAEKIQQDLAQASLGSFSVRKVNIPARQGLVEVWWPKSGAVK